MAQPRDEKQIFVRLNEELVARLDEYVARMAEEQPGLKPNRSDAIRILLNKALDMESARGRL
jgi:Arc/MetJ-type ribon-helix-helix transcriptional regulator